MNKKLLELLDSINEKKASVRNLVNEGKIEEAKAAKNEMAELQEQFDLLKDIEDSTPAPAALKKQPEQMSADAKFAQAARQGFKNESMNETTKADGGYTVPEDIQTKVNQYKKAQFSLEDLVTVESVKTETGARTYQTKTEVDGFTEVGEGAKIGQQTAPKFERITYAIKKYGGWIPVTNELLDDSDANIVNVISQWLGDNSRVTRNKQIIKALEAGKTDASASDPTYTTITGIDDITKALNVTLGAAYKGTSKIITNDYGLQELSELKDGNGRPMLNPIPTEPAKMQLAAGATIVPVEVIPATDLPNVEVDGKVYAPIIIGDLHEAITLFDRKKITLKSSDVASVTGFSAFEEDMTLYRAIERFDAETKDKDAYVLGHFGTEIEQG